jgi:hypothetical protein
VDESEIGSANETATFGSPFHFLRSLAARQERLWVVTSSLIL